MNTGNLTPRQREIVALLAEGLCYKQIADRIGVTRKTVDSHVYFASLRLGLGNKPQPGLVSWHYRQRIAELEATIAKLTAVR